MVVKVIMCAYPMNNIGDLLVCDAIPVSEYNIERAVFTAQRRQESFEHRIGFFMSHIIMFNVKVIARCRKTH